MANLRLKKQMIEEVNNQIKANDPCPCGSGKNYKKCCRKVK